MIEERGVKIDLEHEEEPTKDSEVFYNDDMVLNRDISVSALKTYSEKQDVKLTVLDALSASGIRGIRYLKDVPNLEKVVLNDSKHEAVENIKRNLGKNQVNRDKTEITGKDANLLMTERRKGFHYIDLDPFGSPVRFLDSAARSLKHDSFIGVTATDLATLCGTYSKTCRRRYASWVDNLPYCHEVGLRVLIRAVFESLAKYDKTLVPKLSIAQKHYYRVFGTVRESKKSVNRTLDKIGFLYACRDCGYRRMRKEKEKRDNCPDCDGETEKIGPLWIGKLGDRDFICDTIKNLEEKGLEKPAELLEKIEKESDIRRPYYDTHNFGNITGLPVPRIDTLIEKIRDKGYQVERTHFSPTGIKTTCPAKDLREMIENLNSK